MPLTNYVRKCTDRSLLKLSEAHIAMAERMPAYDTFKRAFDVANMIYGEASSEVQEVFAFQILHKLGQHS